MNTISQEQFLKKMNQHCRRNFIPLKGFFELTPLCNLDCKMCYIHLQDKGVREKLLSGEQWTNLMRQAVDRGMLSATLTGGEAMTHPDFWDIFRFLRSRGVLVTVKTNGLMLNEEAIRRFAEEKVAKLHISLYGCDRESYIAVTGHDAFEQVDRNIRAAAAAGLPLKLMIVPSGYMSPWADRVIEKAKEYGVPIKVNGLLLEPRKDTGRKKADFDLTLDEQFRLLEKGTEPSQKGASPRQEPEEETDGSAVRDGGLKCGAARSSFAVYWTGDLAPCLNYPEELFRESALVSGFDAAWEKAVREVRHFKAPEPCGKCEYREECNYCPVKHYPASLQNACDPNACEYMKRLIDNAKAQPK